MSESAISFDMSWLPAEKAQFIKNNESNLYVGKTKDGLEAQVWLQKGGGCVVKYVQPTKPKWYACVEYDADGYKCGEWFEKKED